MNNAKDNMPPNYIKGHWKKFSAIPYEAAAGGAIPSEWIKLHDLKPKVGKLPTNRIDRKEVRKICQDTSKAVLFGYLCAMAWGNQGGNGRGTAHVQFAWAERKKLKAKLTSLRDGGLSRSEAYNLFCGNQKVKGLGPAYLTKLIYFFSPKPNAYIMDQWTSKSINLLTGKQVVRMDGNYVSAENKCGNYQAYCEEVDNIASSLNEAGDNVEEMLMSGKGKPWRDHVKGLNAYKADVLRTAYPHIPEDEF